MNGTHLSIILTGLNPSTLPQFSTSLVSSTSYIAQVNVTDNSLRGQWRVRVQSQGPYSILVFGSSELSINEDLYRIDDSNTFGFSKIDGRPLRG